MEFHGQSQRLEDNGKRQRLAIVVGGTGGIGSEIVSNLVKQGVFVISVSKERLSATADVSVKCDIRNANEVVTVVQNITNSYGSIEYLVNAAGLVRYAPLVDTDDVMLDELIELNVKPVFTFMREVLKTMVPRAFGRIVTVSSIAGKIGIDSLSAYSATKHAILGITQCAAVEMAGYDITVNAVCPSYVETDAYHTALNQAAQTTGKKIDVLYRTVKASTPQHRVFLPQEVADAVCYLLSDGASGINGQSINICGGTAFT